MTLSCSRTVVREEHWAELGGGVGGEPFPECATQPLGEESFLHSCSRNLTLGCCAQEHFTTHVVKIAQLPCPTRGAPLRMPQPSLEPRLSTASFQGILAAP